MFATNYRIAACMVDDGLWIKMLLKGDRKLTISFAIIGKWPVAR
jgi:hypothetical protein